MLSEHCQKQRWEKPEYTMSKTDGGFSSMVILKATNPKTRETTTLAPFKLPPTHKHLAVQPSPVEARHFAATYALFRVSSMRNIQMMLPPNYRDLWKGAFQDLKKEDVREGRGWMYEADPFLAKRERDDAQAAIVKQREEREKQKAKQASQPGALGGASGAGGAGGGNVMKGWTRAAKIEMGKRMRSTIERLIRTHAVWNAYSVQIPNTQRKKIVDELCTLGFRKSHAEEAVQQCKDQEEALEWLLVHVPEDDLPKWSLPEGYVAGISMASGDLRREAAVKRLAAAGYATELCEKAFDAHRGDEGKAAETLQRVLLHDDEDPFGTDTPDVSSLEIADGNEDGEMSVWDEEQITLEAIFGERFQSPSPNVCRIQLEVQKAKKPFTLQVRRPSRPYPACIPIISVTAEGLPAYIRLSIIRRTAEYAEISLIGEQMIFNLVDWLEHEIPNIIENPGRLSDISSAASAAGEVQAAPKPVPGKSKPRRAPRQINWQPGTEASLSALSRWQSAMNQPAGKKMLAARQSLPAWSLKDILVKTVNDHQVTIISGETGSGKSTQSVQFVLDDLIRRQLGGAANIICTQPRRISALGLADRVSEERCSTVGDEVGYAIRGESKQKPGTTKITFVTTGVLLRRLQTSGGSEADVVAALSDVSHVVVDEVHERSLDTDFLLVLLRGVLQRRKDLKLILMSATLDAEIFENYFRGSGKVGRVEIQGRTFPVQDYYLDDILRKVNFTSSSGGKELEDDESGDGISSQESSVANAIQRIGMRINYDLIARTVQYIDAELGDQDGGILIFLPGTLEINRTLDAVKAIPNIHALPLHASLLPAEQRRVFPPAPKGKRKVIAATNVAETSITIQDIVAVIDTGRVKETSFDPQNNMVKLEEVWASRAACKQRRGRAGRVRAGECYKLYTRNAEMSKMMERPDPEIRRVPLEQLCLSVKAMGVQDVPSFLASALTPPESMAVEGAIDLLGRMGALDGDSLTALGRHLAMIPADLRCGKLIVYGAAFGCLEACLTVAAILTVKSPFVSPQAKRDESKAARAAFARSHGDLLGDLRAYEEWLEVRKTSTSQREVRAWCDDNFLSFQTLMDILSNRSQYLTSLKEIGFIPVTYHSSSSLNSGFNKNNDNDGLIRALIAGAFNPQIARIEFPEKKFAASISGAVELDPEARMIKYFNQENGRVFVHPSSTLFDAQSFPGSAVFMSYFNKMATSKVFIRELTPFNAYTLLLFCGKITLDTRGRGLLVDDWARLRGWARIGVLVSRLRSMLDAVLARKLEDPSLDLASARDESEIINVVAKLVELDGMDR
ncbi:P-loop containing nucleoside triphosphate hydrolase protein [Xylona heveae TC161]|uniref:p-loop containing nucleoside triphosphate hydrolase protein n=1 Tax=Xylona heveae (strain CBS 132557 / TC161) TaxID=1328760 RepID=A0A165JRD0_XYLHT|nr:P-loop containing nucleoside triphosphate hydrolase protein [Xylona heveae TC161]KZF26539.1 P-loop containing nucleoside triphosphate hydrolase protein [Xylona heveae TC161]